MIGNWIIKASVPIKINSGHEMNCGHSEPSNENTAYLAKSEYPLTQEYKLKLDNVYYASVEINNTVHVSIFILNIFI